jgi:O-antigen/teichoic acid export membrane protein
VTIALSVVLIPKMGYRGAAWVRLVAEAAMVVWSFILCKRHYPIPYDLWRIGEYVAITAVIYFGSEIAASYLPHTLWLMLNGVLFVGAMGYAIWREKIDIRALLGAVVRKFIR